MSRTLWIAPCLTALCLLALPASGQKAPGLGFRFVDAGARVGVQPYRQALGMGAGVAAADFEDDGDVDLFVPNGFLHADQLYQNRGDGTFAEIGQTAGVGSNANSRAALWLDYDGDADLDIIVARDGFLSGVALPGDSLLVHRQNENHSFSDATAESGLAGELFVSVATHLGGLCAGDLDRDGDLELCVTYWEGRAYLFRNEGDGSFVDVTVPSGIQGPLSSYWQPLMHDFDEDGWQDLFLARDFFANQLWINQQDGTFLDSAAASGCDGDWNEMGATLGDIDNDQDFDLYITNISESVAGIQRHNTLYENVSQNGEASFVEIAMQAGVAHGWWGWGTTFLDANRDGWLDIAATNGADGLPWSEDPSRLYLNRGFASNKFANVASSVGFDDRYIGSGLASADLDHDGRVDLIQVARSFGEDPVEMLRILAAAGPSDEAHYLIVQPRMRGANHRAIGAVVRVQVGDLTLARLISAGTSYMSQEPAEAHFAWSNGSTTADVTVEWPDGSVTAQSRVAVDRVLRVER